MALTFSGFTSIPLYDTMKLRNYPEDTPKGAFGRVQLHIILLECVERLLKIVLALDEHVVHIYLYVPPNLFTEHLVYQPLVRGPCVLQAEGHDLVTVEPWLVMKAVFS